MADAVSICNLALSYLGDTATVASIDPPEQSTQAQMCAIYYPIARNALLEMHDWSFATYRVQVAKRSEDDTAGWKGVFQMPAGYVRVIKVQDRGWVEGLHFPISNPFDRWDKSPDGVPFTVAGGKLYTNAEKPIVTYVSSQVTEGAFSPLFVTALGYYLAMEMAGARVKGKEGQALAQNLQKAFQTALSLAKTKDAQQQSKRLDFLPEWLQVR